MLELGCGLGLVAVTAALAGARVLAVDRSPEAAAFAAANAADNGVTLQVAVCAFEEPGPLLAGAPWDLVLAADVLYEPRNVPVLLGLLPRLVDDGGEVWLADPGRQMRDPFLAGLAEAGWRCQRLGGEPATWRSTAWSGALLPARMVVDELDGARRAVIQVLRSDWTPVGRGDRGDRVTRLAAGTAG